MMRIRNIATLAIVLMVGAVRVGETRELELTPHYGYRFGGSFTNYWTGSNVDFSDGETYGLTLNIDLDMFGENQIELTWSKKESEVDVRGFVESDTLDFDIDYFHAGVLRHLGDNEQAKPFLVGTLGATHLSPKGEGLSSATQFSIGLGFGVKVMPSERVGLRLQIRAWGTFVDSGAALGCGTGGCFIGFSGSGLWQGEATAGLILRLGN